MSIEYSKSVAIEHSIELSPTTLSFVHLCLLKAGLKSSMPISQLFMDTHWVTHTPREARPLKSCTGGFVPHSYIGSIRTMAISDQGRCASSWEQMSIPRKVTSQKSTESVMAIARSGGLLCSCAPCRDLPPLFSGRRGTQTCFLAASLMA